MRYEGKSKFKAFTLIELLVVVAIISLLVSILLPSLKKAKELAQSVACMSNLRTLAFGTNMYAQDYEGYVMQAVNRPAAGWSVIWMFQLELVVSPEWPNTGNDHAFWNQTKLWRCPAAVSVDQTFTEYGGSYGYNAHGTNLFDSNYGTWPCTPFTLTQIGSNRIILGDSTQQLLAGLTPVSWKEDAYPVHVNEQANMAWVDSHVTSEKPENINKVESYWYAEYYGL